jgi:hypothetical protein
MNLAKSAAGTQEIAAEQRCGEGAAKGPHALALN